MVSVFVETVNISDINNDAISKVLKLAAMQLAYPEIKVIEIKVIKTHPLRYGEGGVYCIWGNTRTGRYKKGTMAVRNTQIIRLRPITFLL